MPALAVRGDTGAAAQGWGEAHPEGVGRHPGAMDEEDLAREQGSGQHRAQHEAHHTAVSTTPAPTPCWHQREPQAVAKAVAFPYTPTPHVQERTTTHDACASSGCACHDRGWGAY